MRAFAPCFGASGRWPLGIHAEWWVGKQFPSLDMQLHHVMRRADFIILREDLVHYLPHLLAPGRLQVSHRRFHVDMSEPPHPNNGGSAVHI
jgi:hypothetical protein